MEIPMTDEAEIREKAYAIWEKAGRPDDAHEAHWQQATDQLNADRSAGDLASGGVESSVTPPEPVPPSIPVDSR
jgi:hypothetical protein